MSIKRAQVIGLMRGAFRRGQSASSFMADMKVKGLRYRRTDMFADWRSVNELEKKKDLLQYVRKDRLPTKAAIAEVTWDIKHEYMYVVKVRSRIGPEEPIMERKVNIMEDRPLTPKEVEGLAWEMIKEQSPKKVQEIVEVMPWTAVRRVD